MTATALCGMIGIVDEAQQAADTLRPSPEGALRARPVSKPVYDPVGAGNSLTTAPWGKSAPRDRLLEMGAEYCPEGADEDR